MTLKKITQYPNFYLVDHPLIHHKVYFLREKSTSKKKFKELVKEITLLMAYETTTDLPLIVQTVETPLETCEAPLLTGKKPVILPILRAGLGMVEGFLDLIPGARVGHIGMFRNEETLEPEKYYFKIPKHGSERTHFVLDPMLATGGTAVAAVSMLKERQLGPIKFVCLVAAPEGVAKLSEAHPDIPIFAAAFDRELNQHGYILPGLGDAGDRIFGTK